MLGIDTFTKEFSFDVQVIRRLVKVLHCLASTVVVQSKRNISYWLSPIVSSLDLFLITRIEYWFDIIHAYFDFWHELTLTRAYFFNREWLPTSVLCLKFTSQYIGI